jgi:hypothetical protein
MSQIAYGAAAYRRDNGNLPELRLVNMYLERAPQEENGVVLLSREGLDEYSAPGNGPVTGIFRADGVFDGNLFTVSGGRLFRDETDLGPIAGTGPVSFAASGSELAVTAGSTLYRYDETDGLDAVTFPESASVLKILFHDGLFLAATASGESAERWYYSAVLDADSWDALDFASAERKPDPLLDMEILSDTLWLAGSATLEPWANTGDADSPYQRFEQRIFDKGVYATGCLEVLDNSLLFVGSDGMVYRLAEVPERISDHGIEERIGQSASVSTFSYIYQGHSFFCIRLTSGTWAYDLSTGQWSEIASWQRDNFRGRCAAMVGRTPVFGDDEEGKVWTFSGHADDGEPLERLFTSAFPLKGGTVDVDNFNIEANVGWTPVLTGDGSEPVVEMRASRDGGNTWGGWRSAPLGSQGNYRARTRWRRCGKFDAPGAMFETRCTDPVPFRVSSVTVNEAGGGRSR